MLDFIYYAPTKVIFGKDKEKEVGSIIKGYGYKKIMIQYGKGSVKQSGLLEKVKKSLTENGIEEQGTHEELIAMNGIYKALYSIAK